MELNVANRQTEIFQTLNTNACYKAGKEGLCGCNVNRRAAAVISNKHNTTKHSVIKFTLQNLLHPWGFPTPPYHDGYSLNERRDTTPFRVPDTRHRRKSKKWSSGGVDDDTKKI
jgi:hypothetical protein